MLRKCPHDLCGLKVGRLTPWIFKVLMSAKESRLSAEYPLHCRACWPCPVRVRVLDQSVSAASPRPRPQFVPIRAQSTFATRPQTCPCPVSELTATAICPWPCRGDVQVVAEN